MDESSAIGTIGVGEATIPTIRRFYARLGMTDMEVMRATHATAKLGISFEGWDHPGSRCLHPFGPFGQDYGGIEIGRASCRGGVCLYGYIAVVGVAVQKKWN